MKNIRRTISIAVVIAAWVIGCTSGVAGATAGAAVPPEPAPSAAPSPLPEPPFDADQVIASLNRALVWYRQARVAMRSLNAATGSVFTRDDEQTALGVVRRAVETARAQAALLKRRDESSSAVQEHRRRAAERGVELQRAIEAQQQELLRLQARLRLAPAREHPQLQREMVTAANRLALHDARREMAAKFEQLDQVAPAESADVERQIQALADSVPELRSAPATEAPASSPGTSTAGTMETVHRLAALHRSRQTLRDLGDTTAQLTRSLAADAQAVTSSIESITARLRTLSTDPAAEGMSLPEGQRTFQELLARAKLMGAILPPLRDESALVRRYRRDLAAWNQALDRELGEALESLAVGLVGVLIAVVAILAGAVLWRVATMRYVQDPYRRRLVMMARRIVVLVGLGLVLVFHFASELTALVTALGFAAAGIAFALQNVILAIAGYFSMMAPDGIRVGDRVSLQGPFGYVHGDVLEIGLVRIRLRELAGDPLRPTGRIVVFSNVVAFTGSFFKHPSGPSSVARPPESKSA